MLSYLMCLNVQNFFYTDFRKLEPVLNFRLNRFLFRGGLTDKFEPNRFLKC